MAKQTINLGTAPTGVGGDTPRSAFTKSQANFDELYAALGASGSPGTLPAALPVAQGGTGGTTQVAARTGLGLGSAAAADIVGLMSSGAIIETGSSATGTWTKFADGTMITQNRGTLGVNITTAYGALFYGVQSALPLPQTFVGDLPKLLLSVSGGPVAALWIGRQSVVTAASTGAFIVMAPSSLPNAAMTIDIVAIGRWKA